MHVQTDMEQLHTHDCYQNVTRHKPGQATVATLNKIYRHTVKTNCHFNTVAMLSQLQV